MRLSNTFLLLAAVLLLTNEALGQDRLVPRRSRYRDSEEDDEQSPVVSVVRSPSRSTSSRRVRVRVRPSATTTQSPQVEYYTASPDYDVDGGRDRIVGVVNELGTAQADETDNQGIYIPQPIPQFNRQRTGTRTGTIPLGGRLRSQDPARKDRPEPVGTVRNYSTINDDGSFTFGYESADGSFKEETRGTDCVVRGKYGYVDPDGQRREFTYVSGNPCDPNNPDGEEKGNSEEEEDVIGDEENIPSQFRQRIRGQSVRTRPNNPRIQQSLEEVRRPSIQQTLDETPLNHFPEVIRESPETQPLPFLSKSTPIPTIEPTSALIEPEYIRPRPRPRPTQRRRPQAPVRITPRPAFVQPTPEEEEGVAIAHRLTPRPKQAVFIQKQATPASLHAQENLPATTYRPKLRPTFLSTTTASPIEQSVIYANDDSLLKAGPSKTRRPSNGVFNFDDEVQRLQFDNSVGTSGNTREGSGRVLGLSNHKTNEAAAGPNGPVYTSELVYDPKSGQYNTVLYQQLPKVGTEIRINEKIPGFVQRPHYQNQQRIIPQQQTPAARPQQFHQQHVQQPQPQPQPQHQAYPQRFVQSFPQTFADAYRHQYQPQYFYPQQPSPYAPTGQIDDFLRAHNLPF